MGAEKSSKRSLYCFLSSSRLDSHTSFMLVGLSELFVYLGIAQDGFIIQREEFIIQREENS